MLKQHVIDDLQQQLKDNPGDELIKNLLKFVESQTQEELDASGSLIENKNSFNFHKAILSLIANEKLPFQVVISPLIDIIVFLSIKVDLDEKEILTMINIAVKNSYKINQQYINR